MRYPDGFLYYDFSSGLLGKAGRCSISNSAFCLLMPNLMGLHTYFADVISW